MNSKSAGRSTNDANMNKELANSTLTTGEEALATRVYKRFQVRNFRLKYVVRQ
jgi:hypothetical protein